MEHTYSPQEYGKLIGRTTNTLQKWDRKGILQTHRSPTNRRYYTHDQYLEYRGLKAADEGQTIVYARVSGVAQKSDLANQIKALQLYCEQHHIQVDEWMQDIGSGLNYKRKQFNRLMELVELGEVRRLIIAHRDRLEHLKLDTPDEPGQPPLPVPLPVVPQAFRVQPGHVLRVAHEHRGPNQPRLGLRARS